MRSHVTWYQRGRRHYLQMSRGAVGVTLQLGRELSDEEREFLTGLVNALNRAEERHERMATMAHALVSAVERP